MESEKNVYLYSQEYVLQHWGIVLEIAKKDLLFHNSI